MAVPYTFATATSAIPLSQLDTNFATAITLGNTAVYLGNTTTSIGNLTLTNVTISSVASTFPNSYLANSSVTLGNTTVSLGGTATSIVGLSNVSSTVLTTPTLNSTTTLSLQTGGTTGLFIDASQNVGIGTTSPGAKLEISSSSTNPDYTSGILGPSITSGNSISLRIGKNPTTANQNFIFNYIYDTTTSHMDMLHFGDSYGLTVQKGGNVGIGTSSPGQTLDVNNSGNYQFRIGNSAAATANTYDIGRNGSTGYLTFYGNQAGFTGYVFSGANGERMRIDSSGNLLVGTTSVSDSCKQTLQFSTGNNGLCVITPDNINGVDFSIFRANGAVCGRISRVGTTSAVVYTTTSDKRLKENITDAPSALEYLNKIKVRSFDWKDCGHHITYGVIAQEFIDVEPDAVLKGDDEKEIIKTWSVDTSVLVPAMIKAIQEQQELIKQLQADVAALKGKA